MANRGRPTKKEVLARRPRCEAKTTDGSPCQRPVGWGVPGFQYREDGNNRCKLHGGMNTSLADITVSSDDFNSLVRKYLNDPNVFNLSKEIATLRAMHDLESERYSTAVGKERDASLLAVNTVIANTIKAVEKFFLLLQRQNFALTVAQARQMREQLKTIMVEEITVLDNMLTPVMPALSEELTAWRDHLAMRLSTELTLEEAEPLALDAG